MVSGCMYKDAVVNEKSLPRKKDFFVIAGFSFWWLVGFTNGELPSNSVSDLACATLSVTLS
jgi:hypothetical protein